MHADFPAYSLAYIELTTKSINFIPKAKDKHNWTVILDIHRIFTEFSAKCCNGQKENF